MPKRSCRTCTFVWVDDLHPDGPIYVCRYHAPRDHVIDVIEMGVRVPEEGWCGQYDSGWKGPALPALSPEDFRLLGRDENFRRLDGSEPEEEP